MQRTTAHLCIKRTYMYTKVVYIQDREDLYSPHHLLVHASVRNSTCPIQKSSSPKKKQKNSRNIILRVRRLKGRVVNLFRGAVLGVLLRLGSFVVEFFGYGRGGGGDLGVVAKLGFAAVLHELLDLHGQPAKLVLVLLVQVALQLWSLVHDLLSDVLVFLQ